MNIPTNYVQNSFLKSADTKYFEVVKIGGYVNWKI